MALFNLRFTSVAQQLLIVCGGLSFILSYMRVSSPAYTYYYSDGLVAKSLLLVVNSTVIMMMLSLLYMAYQGVRIAITGRAATRVIECIVGFGVVLLALIFMDRVTYNVWEVLWNVPGISWQMFPVYYSGVILLGGMFSPPTPYLMIIAVILLAGLARIGIDAFRRQRLAAQ